jgi:hypothetical protein
MVIALLLAAAGFPTLIGPAADGKVQCFSPDPARKVCASITRFAPGAEGVIGTATTAVIGREPPVTMTTSSADTIEGARLCGVTQAADLVGATFTIAGAPADPAKTETLRDAVAKGMSPLVGHKICLTFVPDGSQFMVHTSLDDLPRPDLDQRMAWVSPADGWKVAP